MNWEKSIHSELNEIFVSNPYPKMDEEVKIRLCFLENSGIKNVILRAIINGEETHIDMKYLKKEKNLVYYESEINMNQKYINYHFIIKKDNDYTYYTRRGTYTYPPTEDHDFTLIADFENPSWVPSSVFYQIFPDRFNNGDPSLSVKTDEYEFDGHKTIAMDWNEEPLEYKDGHCIDFFGGDLKGVEDKIDYFKELGVNAIYLNPIFEAKTHHRYDCTDYFHVEKHLGGDEALASLTDAMHKNNMKVMVDVSINHTGNNHVWFKKGLENKESIERDYYYFNDDNSYRGWYNLHTLPQLNYKSEKLREIIYKDENSLVKHYLKKPFNIDAWRFDVGCHTGRADRDQISNEVWKEIRDSIKATKKEAYIIGEHWEDNISYLTGDQWDGAMNYFACGIPLRSFAGLVHRRLSRLEGKEGMVKPCTGIDLGEQIMQHYARLPNQLAFLQFNLIDSHDIFRFHTHEKAYNFELYRGIISLMYMLPGCPNIYYGDEVGVGGHLNSDEGLRYPMVWDREKWNMKHFELYKKLSQMKQNEEALHYGNYKVLYADEDTFVFARYNKEDCFLSILGRNDNKIVEVETGIIAILNGEFQDIFTEKTLLVNNGILKIDLNKTLNTVLKLKRKQ